MRNWLAPVRIGTPLRTWKDHALYEMSTCQRRNQDHNLYLLQHLSPQSRQTNRDQYRLAADIDQIESKNVRLHVQILDDQSASIETFHHPHNQDHHQDSVRMRCTKAVVMAEAVQTIVDVLPRVDEEVIVTELTVTVSTEAKLPGIVYPWMVRIQPMVTEVLSTGARGCQTGMETIELTKYLVDATTKLLRQIHGETEA